MKRLPKSFRLLSAACTLFLSSLLLSGCAGSGQVGGYSGWDQYDKSYNEMVTIVEQAINSSALGIDNIQVIEADSLMRITFSKTVRFQNQDVQEEEADVYIRKLSDIQTEVKIENPDYYFAVPENQRTDYRRILRTRIKSVIQNRG